MFKNILIATDGSTLAEKAEKKAIALARSLKADVIGVYVFSSVPNTSIGDGYLMGYELLRERMRKAERVQGKKYLDRLSARAAKAGVKFHHVIVENDRTWEGIVSTARKKGSDLIVTGAHGRGAFSSLLLGSVTTAVLAHSKVPVLVYR